jgi:glutathione synthase/RimK-type ligase-like ATP-grasp enzyme
VQSYIHPGPRPISHRVGVLFGRAIYRWQVIAREVPGRELPADGDFRAHSGMTVVSTGKGCVFTDPLDPEIIALAERAAAAFPEIPLLGVDIVRRQPDGALFILELNSSGFCFHLSSDLGRKIQASMKLDFMAQYGGYPHVAAQYLRHWDEFTQRSA